MDRPCIVFPPDPHYVTLDTRPRAENKIDGRERGTACALRVHARHSECHSIKRSVTAFRGTSRPVIIVNRICRLIQLIVR